MDILKVSDFASRAIAASATVAFPGIIKPSSRIAQRDVTCLTVCQQYTEDGNRSEEYSCKIAVKSEIGTSRSGIVGTNDAVYARRDFIPYFGLILFASIFTILGVIAMITASNRRAVVIGGTTLLLGTLIYFGTAHFVTNRE